MINNELADLLLKKLADNAEMLKQQFFKEQPIKVARHFALDDLLPADIAKDIYAHFPDSKAMRPLISYGECKLKYSHLKDTSQLIQAMNSAIQHPQVVAAIENITEIKKQVPDQSSYGGITALYKGHFINPHIDNSHDVDKKLYRTVNVLLYLSPDWQPEYGGHYEIWDESVKNSIVVPYAFNRLVVMETNQTSWHSVSPVNHSLPRCCLYNYYFSEISPEGKDYYNVTVFKARPLKKVRLN